MALQLPNSVSSAQDLASLIREVREYARWYSQANIKQRVKAGEIPKPPEMSASATELIQAITTKGDLSQDILDKLIALLEDFKSTAPSLTITLAAPAPGDLRQTLVTWFRKNVDPNILVTFKFNATLLGGMVVSYKSHIFDWSFRRQILANRRKFPEILRNV